jgi:uncharacterized protein YecE (DUF72 family)
MAQLFIGTSGWNYANWKDDFYAGIPRKEWLEFYARHFNAVEIDGSFYHMVKPQVFESWRQRTPADFRFAIKSHRYITHVKRLAPPPESIRLRRENSSFLGEKLAAVLWQLGRRLRASRFRRAGEARSTRRSFASSMPDRRRTSWRSVHIRRPRTGKVRRLKMRSKLKPSDYFWRRRTDETIEEPLLVRHLEKVEIVMQGLRNCRCRKVDLNEL